VTDFDGWGSTGARQETVIQLAIKFAFFAVIGLILWGETALTTVGWWTILKLNLRNSSDITDVWGIGYVFA
jgi:hypothetical protein